MDEDNVKDDRFMFYRSFLDVVLMFPKKDQGKMLKAIIDLGLDDVIDENLPLAMRTALLQMQATIISWKKRQKTNQKNGQKGGAPKENQNAKRKNNRKQPKTTENKPNNNMNIKGNSKEYPLDIHNISSDTAPLEGGRSYEGEELDEEKMFPAEDGWYNP